MTPRHTAPTSPAAKPCRAVFDASLQLDPGKGGGLYVFALHWYCGLFGTGEAALRAFSAAFALASVMLVFALAAELFGAETALIAAALWAFNPIALIVARWARMYSMFIALTLGSLLAMRKVQRHPTAVRIATFGVLGAAMLYTHLGGALMLAPRRRSSRAIDGAAGRFLPACLGIAIALILFVPIAPRRARASARLGAGSSFRLDRELRTRRRSRSRSPDRLSPRGWTSPRIWSSDAIRSRRRESAR